jgi:hypothetical protein
LIKKQDLIGKMSPNDGWSLRCQGFPQFLQMAKRLPVLRIRDSTQRAVARCCFFQKICFRKPDWMSRCHEHSCAGSGAKKILRFSIGYSGVKQVDQPAHP